MRMCCGCFEDSYSIHLQGDVIKLLRPSWKIDSHCR